MVVFSDLTKGSGRFGPEKCWWTIGFWRHFSKRGLRGWKVPLRGKGVCPVLKIEPEAGAIAILCNTKPLQIDIDWHRYCIPISRYVRINTFISIYIYAFVYQRNATYQKITRRSLCKAWLVLCQDGVIHMGSVVYNKEAKEPHPSENQAGNLEQSRSRCFFAGLHHKSAGHQKWEPLWAGLQTWDPWRSPLDRWLMLAAASE